MDIQIYDRLGIQSCETACCAKLIRDVVTEGAILCDIMLSDKKYIFT